jgi:hypothetical protein
LVVLGMVVLGMVVLGLVVLGLVQVPKGQCHELFTISFPFSKLFLGSDFINGEVLNRISICSIKSSYRQRDFPVSMIESEYLHELKN